MFLVLDFDNTLGENYANEYVVSSLGKMPKLLELEVAWKADLISDAELIRRMAGLLHGVPIKSIIEGVAGLKLKPHAENFIRFAHSKGLKTVVVSIDFRQMLQPWCDRLGVDYLLANSLSVQDGRVSGVELFIPDAKAKLAALRKLAKEKSLGEDFITVGDSLADSKLFEASKLSISVGSPIAQHNVSSLLQAERIIRSFLEERK